MTLKRYQIAILFFALGIFAVTYILGTLSKNHQESNIKATPTETPGPVKETLSIKVYFSSTKEDPNSLNCEQTYARERTVTRLSSVDKAEPGELAYLAIAELLKGPTENEKAEGYFTSINGGTKVQNIIISEKTATIDFNSVLNEGVAGSCKVMAIRSQISGTLMQFPGVENVIISVNGESEEILQP
jgi:spore germination protein GerM